jgi:outer membrane cobalamin receptor
VYALRALTCLVLAGCEMGMAWGGEPEQLPPLEVTAPPESGHRTGDVVLGEVPSFFTEIQRDRFAGRLTGLGEVLRGEPGVQVSQAGGLGSFSTASLRGAAAQQVMVYLDGLPLNEAAGGAVDLSQIDLAQVGSIELYRGITPINFARASIGGAVNIRTLRATDRPEAGVSAGYGSFDTRQAGVSYLDGNPALETVLVGAVLDTDNDFGFVSDNGTAFNPNDDRHEHRNNAQVKQASVLLKLGRGLDHGLRLDTLLQLFDKDQGLPSRDNSPATTASLDTRNLSGTVRLRADDIGGAPWNASLRAFAGRRREVFDDARGQIGLGVQETRDVTHRWGLQSYVERVAGAWTLSGIVEPSRETYDSKDRSGRRADLDTHRDVVDAAVQAALLPWGETLLLAPALRLNAYKDHFGPAGDDGSKRYLRPQSGLRYRPWEGLTLRANWGRYVRLPSFFELFGDRGFIIGNPGLQPEKGTNYDLGFQVDRLSGAGWLRSVDLSAAYFHTDVDDLIVFLYDARGVGRAVNISEARIQGVELSLHTAFATHTGVTLNYTWQDPVNRSSIAAFDGKRLPGRYRQQLSVRLEQSLWRARLYYEFDYETGLFYDAANLLEAKDVHRHNLGLAMGLGRWDLGLAVNNIGNKNFQDFNGFPTPGRSFSGTVSYRFEP